jgi:hypothetical protein
MDLDLETFLITLYVMTVKRQLETHIAFPHQECNLDAMIASRVM